MSDSMVVFGAGGHGKVVVGTAQACGLTVTAVIDDDPSKWGGRILGVPVVSPEHAAVRPGAKAVIGVGTNTTRRQVAGRLELEWVTLVHPHAYVHPSARLGEGAVVLAGAVVQPDARIGAHAIVNTSASVDHDNVIGAFAHLAPGTHLGGHVTVEEGAFLGIGVSVTPGRRVGAWAIVGAGAVVIHDVAPNTTVAGVPARSFDAMERR